MSEFVASWKGWCPICETQTTFSARQSWFRDWLYCSNCQGGNSLPRERGLMMAISRYVPNWRTLAIHESSPGKRVGLSDKLRREASSYLGTQYFPDIKPGTIHEGWRCENLEAQTFEDCSIDLVITQDVMEHVFHPDVAYREVFRTLKPGGYYLHTVPIHKELAKSRCVATKDKDGNISHLEPPEYHGNPVNSSGALLTFRYGYDLGDLIACWTGFDVEILRFHDKSHGIVAEMTEVVVCRRPA